MEPRVHSSNEMEPQVHNSNEYGATGTYSGRDGRRVCLRNKQHKRRTKERVRLETYVNPLQICKPLLESCLLGSCVACVMEGSVALADCSLCDRSSRKFLHMWTWHWRQAEH